jgi:leucyl aminopeptidase
MSYPTPVAVASLSDASLLSPASNYRWDALICVFSQLDALPTPELQQFVQQQQQVDQRIGREVVTIVAPLVAGSRLILAPTGPLHRDYDDVRAIADVAKQAITQAKAAGAVAPLLWVEPLHEPRYQHALEVAYLAVCQALWQPLEAREARGEQLVEPVHAVGLLQATQAQVTYLAALEAGRRLGRDLCGTEPERMTPKHFAQYCQQAFAGTAVQVSVQTDIQQLNQQYPLLMAVARASLMVERHQPAVIRLEYKPSGPVTQTLLFAGKGLVYDTGGADLKVGGAMAGMSRDKGGAAAVAGFMKTLAEVQPAGLHVIAEIGAVRNSIGSDAFVPDEIITSHAGVRVRIGNTDAEGRLVLADLLSHLREDAAQAINPTLFTVATLTGHAARAVGPYTALVENGAARQQGLSARLAEIGELWADPADLSSSRREDFSFVKARSTADDVLSCNNAPSSVTARGHQFPMAFLVIAAGLEQASATKQGTPYIHIDIAGSGVDGSDWQHGKPSAAPVVALAATYLR